MKYLYVGKPLKVVEEMKKEMIYQIKMIKLDDKNFETNEVENIQHNMNMYLEIINGIYQDLIIEYIDKDTKIFVAEDSYGELGYNKIGDEDNE